MLYMVNFCPSSPYLKREDAAMSFPDAHGRVFMNPLGPAKSEETYGALLDEGIKQGMTMFEIDFMEKNFASTPYFRTVAAAADGWLAGMSKAAEKRRLPTQLCSDSARDVIASVALPAITQFRGSVDFACDCVAEPLSGNWAIGQQSLLVSSFGLGSSKDTFFTNPVQKGHNHPEHHICQSYNNGHVELDLFAATMSGGPVGFGDGIGDTNRTLLMQCCASDGTILRADTASSPIDATWSQASDHKPPVSKGTLPGTFPPVAGGPLKAAAAIWSASTLRNGSYFHFVTAIDVPTSFKLLDADLWPVPAKGTQLLHRRWHAAPCVDGAMASSCGVAAGLPDVKTGIPAGRCQNKTQNNSTCTAIGAHSFELFSISPVTKGGVALLGELSKVCAVSAERFAAVVVTSSGGLKVTVRGSTGEKVQLTFVVGAKGGAGGRLKVKTLSFGPSGQAVVAVDA